ALIQGKNIKEIALDSLIDDSKAKRLEKNLPSLESYNFVLFSSKKKNNNNVCGEYGRHCTKKFDEEFRSVLSTFKAETTMKDKSELDNTHKTKEKESFWKKVYQNASEDSKAKQLAEMFSIPVEAAQMAIETYGYVEIPSFFFCFVILTLHSLRKILEEKKQTNMHGCVQYMDLYEKAVTELSDVEAREHFLAMVSTDKDETFEKVEDFLGSFGGENSITTKDKKQGKAGILGFFTNSKKGSGDEELKDIEPMMRTQSENNIQVVNPQHMLRTIAVMMQHNFLLRVLTFALKVLMNGNKFDY
ncbi:hypothetical protein RFI_20693, partial [Reticulomyxa filosa]